MLDYLLALPPEARRAALNLLGEEESDAFDRAWPLWAHRGQQPEPDRPEWRTWVLMAGRGFGKTLAGAKWVTEQVAQSAAEGAADGAEPLQIALVGATIEDTRRVMVEGKSGLLEVADAWVTGWHPSLHRLTFRTGAQATLFSGAHPDRLRGPEHHFAWCDELAKWEKPGDTWDMLQLGLRLGPNPRALVTTTPRPGEALSRIMEDPDTIITTGATRANPHTPAAWKGAVHRLYAGTRLGAQELEGQLLTDSPGALWTVELLASCRAQGSERGPVASQRVEPASAGQPAPCSGDRTDVTDSLGDGPAISAPPEEPLSLSKWRLEGPPSTRPNFTKIVIGVDPPSGDGTCGIIVCAKDAQGTAHVLADHSVTARSPEGWARAVADAAAIHSRIQPSPLTGEGDSPALAGERGEGAKQTTPEQCEATIPTLIVAESNQGGRMVKSVLHTADPNLHVKPVTARADKSHRAEPVAHLFEAGKVVLHGRFEALEAQLLGLIAGGGYEGPGDTSSASSSARRRLNSFAKSMESSSSLFPPTVQRKTVSASSKKLCGGASRLTNPITRSAQEPTN